MIALWKRLERLGHELGWPWLAGYAKRAAFRAELRRVKLDTAKLREESGPSDEREAALAEGITAPARKPRRALPPKAKRSASHG